MSTPQEPPSESEPFARRDELVRLAGEVQTMEERINGRARAESARIDGERNTQAVEHRAQLGAVLEAIKTLGQSMDLKMKAMEERLAAEMKAMKENWAAEMKVMEERRIADMKAMEERRVADMKAMEERRVADMKAMEEKISLEMKIVEERLSGQMSVMKWGIGLLLAAAVANLAGVFTPQISALFFAN